MIPERFQEIEELYHAARDATPEERAALLARADPELRREVESLLAQRASGEFLDRPAIQHVPEFLGDSTATVLPAGACLGPYRIEQKLGEGGMGEVFRAIDTRLGRAVAIKTAREQFSSRFEREARAISSLNHPNICTLYDVGPNYLVLELVEGETIAHRLKQGPIPLERVCRYALQIAAALAEAHGKGIVHRDLKPGNIMIAKSGIKVLDFGLAKSGQDEPVTASHMVLGTPAYMSPEQREGKAADARSDIYSLGCVVYEMSTGARVTTQRKRIPSPQLERIVSRCLEEDPGRRWQSAVELEPELAAVAATGSRSKRMIAAVSAASMLGLFATAYWYLHRAPRLTDKDTIVLADFVNNTGDPIFDGTLRQGLAIQLEQSPFLRILDDDQVQRVIRLMSLPTGARICDVSPAAVERARLEASQRSLDIQFSVANMLDLTSLGDSHFDAVICMDNALPHLESAEQLLQAAEQVRARLRPGGCLMASIRDYDRLIEEKPVVQGPSFYSDQGHRRIVFQVWDWVDDRRYHFHLYITRELAQGWQTFHTSALYRALRRNEVMAALSQARFKNARWLFQAESGFYQPIVLAEAD